MTDCERFIQSVNNWDVRQAVAILKKAKRESKYSVETVAWDADVIKDIVVQINPFYPVETRRGFFTQVAACLRLRGDRA